MLDVPTRLTSGSITSRFKQVQVWPTFDLAKKARALGESVGESVTLFVILRYLILGGAT